MPRVCSLESARLSKLQEWTEALAAGPRTAFERDRFLLNLLHLVTVGVDEEPPPGEMPDWLARACKGIRQPDAMQEGVVAWVRLCGRGPEHVARVTRSWLGLSPTEYVNRVRLAYVERQVRSSSIPILDVAMDAGFTNPGHTIKPADSILAFYPLQWDIGRGILMKNLACYHDKTPRNSNSIMLTGIPRIGDDWLPEAALAKLETAGC